MFRSNARFGGRYSNIIGLEARAFSSKQVAESAISSITSFGFKEVEKEEKEGLVREVF